MTKNLNLIEIDLKLLLDTAVGSIISSLKSFQQTFEKRNIQLVISAEVLCDLRFTKFYTSEY